MAVEQPMFEQTPNATGQPDVHRRLREFERRLCKDKVRFAVGKPGGHHSSVWVTRANRSDFYIGARTVMGSTKISLHESGICRLGLTASHFDLAVEQGLIPAEEDRAFVK
jgi:hypothetical protein